MKNVPLIKLPFCTQEEFDNAVKTVEMCKVERPVWGFMHPFFAPGGAYGECWWSLDAALAVDGYKWIDYTCEEDIVNNLLETMESDGRVKLYGIDGFGHIPSVKEQIASIPRFYDTCYTAAKRRNDKDFSQKVYKLLSENLKWWFEKRQDKETSLISAVFEETFRPNIETVSMEYFPMDTNMQIVSGCFSASALADVLNIPEKAKYFREKAKEILEAVNKYLWNEKKGAYYPYLKTENSHYDVLMASTFNGMLCGNAGKGRAEILVKKLLDNDFFGWDEHTVTSVARNDKDFAVVTGEYIGNPCWSGSVWTYFNKIIIKGLKDSGYYDIASELAYKTVVEFADNYTEFHHPFDGSGHGVYDYAWTASQFIQIIIEDVFGIDYDAVSGTITVKPNVPVGFFGEMCSVEGLVLPDGNFLDVFVKDGKTEYKYNGSLKVVTE